VGWAEQDGRRRDALNLPGADLNSHVIERVWVVAERETKAVLVKKLFLSSISSWVVQPAFHFLFENPRLWPCFEFLFKGPFGLGING